MNTKGLTVLGIAITCFFVSIFWQINVLIQLGLGLGSIYMLAWAIIIFGGNEGEDQSGIGD